MMDDDNNDDDDDDDTTKLHAANKFDQDKASTIQ